MYLTRDKTQSQDQILVENYVDAAGTFDTRFDWRTRKQEARRLARLYRHIAQQEDNAVGAERYRKEAAKVGGCAEYVLMGTPLDALDYVGDEIVPDVSQSRVRGARLCRSRLCPVCTARRAQKAAPRLQRIMERVEADHPGVQWIFLTLTIKNVDGAHLRQAFDTLRDGWRRLYHKHRKDDLDLTQLQRAIKGWFRAVECTYSPEAGYHPHLHAVVAVDRDYFVDSAQYISQRDLCRWWDEAADLHYEERYGYVPICDIRRAYDKRTLGQERREASMDTNRASYGATLEAAKYAVKGIDFLSDDLSEDEAAQIVRAYTDALRRKRLTACGGWLRDAAQALDVDLESMDGVEMDDQEETDDRSTHTVEYVQMYRWTYGKAWRCPVTEGGRLYWIYRYADWDYYLSGLGRFCSLTDGRLDEPWASVMAYVPPSAGGGADGA